MKELPSKKAPGMRIYADDTNLIIDAIRELQSKHVTHGITPIPNEIKLKSGIAEIDTDEGSGAYTVTEQIWDPDAGPAAWIDAQTLISGSDARDFNNSDAGTVGQKVRFWEQVDDNYDTEILIDVSSTVGPHTIINDSTHTDGVGDDAVTAGSLIYGNATPKWDELVVTDKGVLVTASSVPLWRTAGADYQVLQRKADDSIDFDYVRAH